MSDQTTDDAEVLRRAAQLVRAMDDDKASAADAEARETLTKAELDMASAIGMEPAEYLRFKSPRPEAA